MLVALGFDYYCSGFVVLDTDTGVTSLMESTDAMSVGILNVIGDRMVSFDTSFFCRPLDLAYDASMGRIYWKGYIYPMDGSIQRIFLHDSDVKRGILGVSLDICTVRLHDGVVVCVENYGSYISSDCVVVSDMQTFLRSCVMF